MINYKLPTGKAIAAKSVSNGDALLSDYFLNLKGKKIMLYGDSIFSDDYPWLGDSLKEISGAIDVYCGGFSGYTTADLAASASLARATGYEPDVLVIMLGGNDTGAAGTVGTFGTVGGLLSGETTKQVPDISQAYAGTTFIEATAYIANYLTYHVGGFRHNAYLAGDCTDVGQQLASESDLDGVAKPLVVLCTPIPEKRNDAADAYSIPQNNLRKAEATREAAKLLNIPLLDLATLSGFSGVNEPYYVSPTDKVHNKGTWMMDGLHPNKYGYRRIAKLILHFISNYFV